MAWISPVGNQRGLYSSWRRHQIPFSLRGAVEPRVHAPERVQPARVGRIGVVDDTVREHEGAHARPLAHVGGRVDADTGRDLGDRSPGTDVRRQRAGGPVVVFEAPLALLRLGQPDVPVEVEVALGRGRPRERPSHALPVRQKLRERRARHRPEHHVMVGQVNDGPVEAVRDRRARGAAGGVVGPEHEVVDEELRAPGKEVRQRDVPLLGVESILLVDPHPRQLLPPLGQLVALPRELLFRREQIEPRREPFFPGPRLVHRRRSGLHHESPFLGCPRWASPSVGPS